MTFFWSYTIHSISLLSPKFTFRQGQISFKANSHTCVCIYACVCVAWTERERSILCVNLISRILSFCYLILDELELKNACARTCTHTRTVCTQMQIYIFDVRLYVCILLSVCLESRCQHGVLLSVTLP